MSLATGLAIVVVLLVVVVAVESTALISIAMNLRDERAAFRRLQRELGQFRKSSVPGSTVVKVHITHQRQDPPDPSLVRSAKKVNDEVERLL